MVGVPTERLSVNRNPAVQVIHCLLAFGFGVHRCMGNRMAELQLRVLWEEIMKRFHTVELVGDVERIPNNFIRGVKDVPVRLHPI